MILNAAAIDGTEDIPFSSDPGFSVSGRIERIEPALCGDMRLTLSFSRFGSRELTPDESHNAAFIEAFRDESDPEGLSHSRAACSCVLRAGRPSAVMSFCATSSGSTKSLKPAL